MGQTDAQAVAKTRTRGDNLRRTLPAVLLTGATIHARKRAKRTGPDREAADRIEAGYDGLQGQWRDWLDVARWYERKIPSQDRMDFRHTVLLRLATMHRRTGKTLDEPQVRRVASYCVADYYYTEAKLHRGLDCRHCPTAKRKDCATHNLYAECPKIRDVISLDREWTDANGDTVTLADMIADDTAIDLDLWLDAHAWLSGCPVRLVEIAYKLDSGQKLADSEQRYLYNYRYRDLKKTQLSLKL